MKTSSQRESERKAEEKTQELRITEGEKRASTLIDRGQAADTTKQIALDMSAYADSNPRVFQLMQTATLKDAVLRSIEKMGAPLNIDPRTILQYKLQDKDIEALQMFAQKSAQLTVELRKASRAPGEGATTESEGRLYAQVEALPTDTARVICLHCALITTKPPLRCGWTGVSRTPGNRLTNSASVLTSSRHCARVTTLRLRPCARPTLTCSVPKRHQQRLKQSRQVDSPLVAEATSA